ncbi:MAG: hypothetical protein GY835_24705, partial [bacterium]|nr:hypothetical protein [bacterium]
SGESKQYTITVAVDLSTAGTITNTATVGSNTGLVNRSDNTATEPTTVNPPPSKASAGEVEDYPVTLTEARSANADIFADDLESGDTCAWSFELPVLLFCGPPSAEGVVVRVLRDARIDCGPIQLVPVVEHSGSIRLELPASDTFHLHLSEEGTVVLNREVSAGVGEVIEIDGLELASYELEITAEDRAPIRFSIDLNAGNPCAAFEIDP